MVILMNHVTVQDIADRLGLSRNTISKVLNGKTGVLPETQNLILKTAKEMGYYKFKPALLSGTPFPSEPNAPAAEEHRMILLLTTKGKYNTFWDSMASGVYEEFAKHSYSFIYGEATVGDDGSVEFPAILAQGMIDGIVVMNVYEPLLIDKIAQLHLPTVYYDTVVDKEPVDIGGDILVSDGIYAMREMTKHLLQNGAEKICFIGDMSAGMSIHDRWQGFVSAHSQMDRPLLPELCLTKDDTYFLNKKNLAAAVDRLPAMPDAFVCANDGIAHALIQHLRAHSVRVPRDVKICGYDDLPTSTLMHPYLTSAKVPNGMLGKRIAQALLTRIRDKDKPFELVRIYPNLQFRESTEF